MVELDYLLLVLSRKLFVSFAIFTVQIFDIGRIQGLRIMSANSRKMPGSKKLTASLAILCIVLFGLDIYSEISQIYFLSALQKVYKAEKVEKTDFEKALGIESQAISIAITFFLCGVSILTDGWDILTGFTKGEYKYALR
jgi:hypothetical protein